jgi:mono/diheme cytochrome c family protein
MMQTTRVVQRNARERGVVVGAGFLACFVVVAVTLLASCAERAPVANSPDATNQQGAGDQNTATWDESLLPRFAMEVSRPDLAARGSVGRQVANLKVTTLAGATYMLDDLLAGKRGIVIAMASVDCPIAKKYAPRMSAIERENEGQFAFVHINTVDGETLEAIREAVKDTGFRGAYARDIDGSIRRELVPKTTTEVFVLDANRVLRYRGAIDDGFRFGGAASEVRRAFLRDALRSLAASESPKVTMTQAPGCLVDIPADAGDRQTLIASSDGTSNAAITFYPQVAEVLARNCIECHATRGAGPFRLATPADLEGRMSMVAAVVREGVMPPTHGLAWSGESPLVKARMMSREDRETLLAWLDSGRSIGVAPRSSTSTPVPGAGSLADNTWAIGAPDQILVAPGPVLNTDGPPVFGRFLVPVNNDKDEWVTAIETRPTMHDSIDTAKIWLLRAGDRLPGPGDLPRDAELFATFSKPERVVRYEGKRLLPAGSVLVVDVLARPTGKETRANLRIAMKFAGTEESTRAADGAREQVSVVGIAPEHLSIAPGGRDARVQAVRTFDSPVRIVALTPVLGQRGQEVMVELQEPGKPTVTLLDLRRWDWRWLIRYPLARPVEVAAGGKIVVRARLDNSEGNPANPDSSARVSLGAGAGREVVYVGVETTPEATARR